MKTFGRTWVAASTLLLFACGGGLDADGRKFVGAESEAIRYLGRFERSNPTEPRIAWAGSAVRMGFTGTSLAVRLMSFSGGTDEYGEVKLDRYDVVIDGEVRELVADPARDRFVVAEGLRAGAHEVTLFKRTEPWIGDGKFLGFEIDETAQASLPSAIDRRIEFIGDDVLVGLGVEGPDASCDYSARFQNHSASFATLTARALAAEHTAIGLSGVGVSRNYDTGFDDRLPDVFLRTFPKSSEPRWQFSAWVPQAVVINAGAVDFLGGNPGGEAFKGEYRALLERVRAEYPDALVVVTFGPTLSDQFPAGARALTSARTWLGALVAERHAAGDQRIRLMEFPLDDGARGYGCDFHPNRETHRLMSEQLTTLLRQELGW